MIQREGKKMSEQKRPLLEVNGLTKIFDVSTGLFKKDEKYVHAVNDVSFYVEEGETFGIVGESGCGKTTTGNLVVQLLEKTEGTIVFDGVNLDELSVKELREKRKEFQMVFQDPFSSLNPRKRVFDIIAEPLRTHLKISKKDLEERVFDLIKTVGLHRSYAYRYPHEFSGGQRQRIGIARAIALRPKLVVCDEPVSALDVSIQSQILNLLKQLQEEMNLTFIFIAHGLPAVRYISDRVAVMYLGKIVECASKEDLFNNPKHPYTEGLLSSIPIPDPRKRKLENQRILEGDIPNAMNLPSGCHFHPRCPYATELCKEEAPAYEEIAEGHSVACHYPLSDGKGLIKYA